MVKPRVLVTRKWPEAVEAQLLERYDAVLNQGDVPLSPKEFRDALQTYDAVLPTVTDKLCAEALDVPKAKTKILANYGPRCNHMDKSRLRDLGVTVTNTPDVVSECAADIAMTLMLMIARRAGEGEREVREGRWTGWHPTHLMGTKVSGKTLGIVGFGKIGREVAKRAHHGFGMEIVVQSRASVPADVLAKYNATQVESLEELLPISDFVTLHCSSETRTRHLIDETRLGLMKPDAYLINAACSELVDERALAQALWFETIGGAAMDVFDGEPLVNRDLMASDNLVMLPHLGSATREAREAMGFRVIDNLTDFFGGREPRDQVI